MMDMQERPRTQVVKVVEAQGHCPVYRLSDCIRIVEGYMLIRGRSMCMHALQAVCSYCAALSQGIAPDSKEEA